MLKSKRGPHGGYMFTRDPSRITVGEIIQAVQGPIVPVACLTNGTSKSAQCAMMGECVTRHVWRGAQQRLTRYYNSVTLGDLCEMAIRLGVKRDPDSGSVQA